MDPETNVVTDNTLRQSNPDMDAKLKQHEAENLARAAAREEERLNKPSFVARIIDAIAKIKRKAAKSGKAPQMRQNGNSR